MQKSLLWAPLIALGFACGDSPTEPPVVPPAPLVLSTTTLADAALRQPYQATLEATGGVGPYVFSIDMGTLPAGLTLTGAQISGTPTAPGRRAITVKVTDARGTTATKALELYVTPDPLVVATSSLAQGSESTEYEAELAASGGVAPYTWTIRGGALPAGLMLASDGTIEGEPTTAGASAFTVEVTDAEMKTATRELMLTVRPLLPMIATTTLTRGLLQTNFEERLVVTSGHGPFTWTISMGRLPRGVGLANDGTIAGRPLESGVFRFVVRVTDSRMRSDEAELALVILAPLAITTRSLPNAILNLPYDVQLTATGGLQPYRWALVGMLPSGLTFMDGRISGTTSAAGEYPITVRVQDDAGGVRSVMYTLVVDDVIVVTATQTAALVPACSTPAPRTCVPWENTVCTSTTVSYQSVPIVVANSFSVTDVTVRVNVDYSDRGRSYNTGNPANNRNLRLKLQLVAPDGRVAVLCGNAAGHRQESGCDGSNGIVATYPGTASPETPLSVFDGMNAQGTWLLQAAVAWPTVDNTGACQQGGTINEVELTFDDDRSPDNYVTIDGFAYNNLIRDPWVRISGGNQVPDNNQIQLVATEWSVGPNGVREAGRGDDVREPTVFTWMGTNLPRGTVVEPDGLVTGGPITGDAQVTADGGGGLSVTRRLLIIPPDWNLLRRAH